MLAFLLQISGFSLAIIAEHLPLLAQYGQLGRVLALSGGSLVHILVAACFAGMVHRAGVSRKRKAIKIWCIAVICFIAAFAGIPFVLATTDLFLWVHCVIECSTNILILLLQAWQFWKGRSIPDPEEDSTTRRSSLTKTESSRPDPKEDSTTRWSSPTIMESSSPDPKKALTTRWSFLHTPTDDALNTSPIHIRRPFEITKERISPDDYFPFDDLSLAQSFMRIVFPQERKRFYSELDLLYEERDSKGSIQDRERLQALISELSERYWRNREVIRSELVPFQHRKN
ncbi:hypothetical protein K469DRAFT_702904 [Zopfia rhizophila CBS 207.26]|uniref:Uncharacterized protein n=1 Tax=Zopfia rhizophila CBS 207.26 TaxID=1314779 RepID=A0A6A6D761_9PEZI|nr:hypothetical protein K469DRAFT_702904 [Zopfia rhizophila CBS 207.26]